MIEKIVFSLYRKICKDHYKRHIELEIEHENRIRNPEVPVLKDEYIKVFDAIKRDNVQILGVERNRATEYVVVCKSQTKEKISISLYGPSYIDVNKRPKIMAEVDVDQSTGANYMHIEDILMVNDNIGNGSICMRYFLQEVQKLNITEIRGILSLVDEAHFDRSIHFYKKHGFRIDMDEDNRSGQIRCAISLATDADAI